MTATHQVLVVLAHPALEKSRVNGPLARAAADVPGVTVHDLYQDYPDFFIDKAREQARILEHQVLVFQHPLYWYSAPALLKEWLDIVLDHGFAYGRDGNGLTGRVLLNAWSAGSPRADFVGDTGADLVPELMRPFERTANYCGMRYLPPFTVYDTGDMTREQVASAADDYARLLTRLTTAEFLGQDFDPYPSMRDALRSPDHG